VRLSGKLAWSGSRIAIEDIRIDHVQDESTRNVIDLLQSAAGSSLPRSVNMDLLPLLEPTNVPGTGIRVTPTNLSIASVLTLVDAVDVKFDIKLIAR
jgi:hypothetical protein